MEEYGTSSVSCPVVCFGISFVDPLNFVTMCEIEVLMAVKMSVLFFWVVTPCGLVGRYQCYGEIYCLCLHMFISWLKETFNISMLCMF
jgi:hypothetical protein